MKKIKAFGVTWWPDQVAHLVESVAATTFGFVVSGGDPKMGAATGFVFVVSKEGEDLYYKWKSGEWAAGDIIDFAIHLFGVSIPVALFIWFGG